MEHFKPGQVDQAIRDVQAQVEAIARDTAKIEGDRANYRYSFIPEDGLMDFLRPKLTAAGIASYVSTAVTDRAGAIVEVTATARFVHVEDGSWHTVQAVAQAGDKGDKAVAKASTSAVRFLLWKQFLVPNEDPNANPETTYDPRSRGAYDAGAQSADGDPSGYGDPEPPPITYTEAEARQLWADVRTLAHSKGGDTLARLDARTTEVLAKHGTTVPHPDWLLRTRAALEAMPTPELPADPPPAPVAPAAAPPGPPAAPTPPAPPPAPQAPVQAAQAPAGGISPATTQGIAALIGELQGLAPGQNWQDRVNGRIQEWFGKTDTAQLTDQEGATLIQRLTQTKISLQQPTGV